jgi:hypothetical protein
MIRGILKTSTVVSAFFQVTSGAEMEGMVEAARKEEREPDLRGE